jgi:hypothetical protein
MPKFVIGKEAESNRPTHIWVEENQWHIGAISVMGSCGNEKCEILRIYSDGSAGLVRSSVKNIGLMQRSDGSINAISCFED